MTGLYYLNVTIHVLAAMLWVGGMFFLAIVGAPALREVEPAALRAQLFRRIGERFRPIGWGAIVVLVITGALNLAFRELLSWEILTASAFWSTGYGHALAWKLAAVAVMIGASAVHDFIVGPAASRMDSASDRAARARRRASILARIGAVGGLVAVIAAVRLARGA